jgi:hypothetical protein
MRRCSRAPSSIYRALVESRAAPQRCRNQATGQNSKFAISDAVSTGSARMTRRRLGVSLGDTCPPYVPREVCSVPPRAPCDSLQNRTPVLLAAPRPPP